MGNEQSTRIENVWIPETDFPNFRAYTVNFYNTCREFQMTKLLPALAIGMDLPKDFFHHYHEHNENQLRLLHYPEAPTSVFDSGEKGRIGAHTDFGTATLLFQDDCGGLEVENHLKPGEFMSIRPELTLVNIGDFLMRWSNDTLKSTLHRVRAPPKTNNDNGMTRERFSIPYVRLTRLSNFH